MGSTQWHRMWHLVSVFVLLVTVPCWAGEAKQEARLSKPARPDEPTVDATLLAHWTFDEHGGDVAGIRAVSEKPDLIVRTKQPVPRTRGVYGTALDLRGTHALPTAMGPHLKDVSRITISAWVMPSDLSGYREIFRQECRDRVLFSFQNSGTILSLGLNVNGYAECDAPINPSQILNGRWHHCAATFDGKIMRVYLDGKEVGSMKRSGKLLTQSAAPAFIGSLNGASEHFQGALDDLRIYREALTAKQIALLHRHGERSIDASFKRFDEQIAGFFVPGKTLGATLAATQAKLVKTGKQLEGDLAMAVLRRLESTHREEYAKFLEHLGASPLEYLKAKDNRFIAKKARRLVTLLVEYKPLTDSQWKCQTPEQLLKWKEVEIIEKKLKELMARGDSAKASPEWIDVILAASEKIQYRPSTSEAVAPYVTPTTPPTRNLSAAEARQTLHRDWLHQAGGNADAKRIQDEIRWARRLAKRIRSSFSDKVDFSEELAKLTALAKQAASVKGPANEWYFKVREIKRSIALENPVVDFQKILLVDMPYPAGSEWHHQTRHRLGYMAVPGARLLILDGLSPEGKLHQLMPQSPLHGSFWRPDVSYDGRKVLFCFKPHNEKSFHLYQINVDGSDLVQLTDGRFDDLDPIYLPDGKHIMFSTTRGHTYVRCMPPTNAFVLARSDRNGENIYLVSHNNEPDYLPAVMNDGKIIYTRWEYTDKPLWRAQALWTVNPDGTHVSTFWGNQSVWPDLLKDARSIPGSQRVMFTGSAHHDWFAGSVGIIDPNKGFNFPGGLTKVTAEVVWPESGNGPVDPIESADYHTSGKYSAYYSPHPLSERDFLVSANRNGKFVLYLMDVDGNRELIYEGTHNILHAMPLKARRKPPVVADKVAWPAAKDRLHPKPGVIISNNVYDGAPKILQDKAKFLRVLNIEEKTYTYWHKRPYLSTGPVVSVVQSEGVKRVLGTVPIEADGSVAFYAPPVKALHFQLLDENYRALQTMRSFTGVMPGERRGCTGCHESHSKAPYQRGGASIAGSKQPRKITPPPWGSDTVSYLRYVRPLLDKYCGKCHMGDGTAKHDFDLTARPGLLGFDEPYLIMTGRPTWGRAYQRPKNPEPGLGIAGTIMVEGYGTRDPEAYRTRRPMTRLSYNSRLIELAGSGKHYGVKADAVSLRKLIAWVDTMCPYRGDKEIREIPDPVFQGVDWLAIPPKIKNAPRIVRPGPIE